MAVAYRYKLDQVWKSGQVNDIVYNIQNDQPKLGNEKRSLLFVVGLTALLLLIVPILSFYFLGIFSFILNPFQAAVFQTFFILVTALLPATIYLSVKKSQYAKFFVIAVVVMIVISAPLANYYTEQQTQLQNDILLSEIPDDQRGSIQETTHYLGDLFDQPHSTAIISYANASGDIEVIATKYGVSSDGYTKKISKDSDYVYTLSLPSNAFNENGYTVKVEFPGCSNFVCKARDVLIAPAAWVY